MASHMMILYLAHTHGLSFRNGSVNPSNQNRYASAAETTLKNIETIVQQNIDTENEYLKEYFKLDVRIIFNYVLEKASSRAEIIHVALEVRETKEATAFRKQLTLLDEAAAVDHRRQVQ